MRDEQQVQTPSVGAPLVGAWTHIGRGTSCESSDAQGHCITCSDEALPVQVLRADQERGLAWVTVQNKTEEVDISLVEHVVPGDVLLVHGGVAIAHLGDTNHGE